MRNNCITTKKTNTIEKFTGSFSTEQGGCSVFINSTLQLITDGFSLGIYCYLMSLPDTWVLNPRQLATHFGCNKDKIYKNLTLLKDMGLLTCENIREKGKFSKYHYTVHLHPQKTSKSQSNKGNLPRPEKPDVVNPYVEKADTYKTKNIQNKEYKKTITTRERDENTKSSSSDFVISKKEDKRLLKLREVYLKDDDRLDIEFLRQCYQHVLESKKNGYTPLQALKGLEKIIKAGCFEKPNGYKSMILPSLPSPEIEEMHKKEWEKRIEELRKLKEEGSKKRQEIKKVKTIFRKTNVNQHLRNYCY